MLKSVKGKVIAGTVAFGLLSGVGVAFGATDAGTHLKTWYDTQFGRASDQISSEMVNYGNSKIDGLVAEYNGLKDNTTTKLTERGNKTTDATNKGIQDTASGHIDAIKNQKAEIEKHLESQFKTLSDFAAGLINESGQKALDYANEDLKNHAGEVSDKVKGEMTEKVNKTTAQAVADLEETIKFAKEDLQAQLDKNTELTIVEVKGLIDAKINELRTKITAKNNALISEQDKIITMTAKALLLKAQADLQAIVDGINK